jgi:N-methylhydantoinase A/oxoprolinase/acetone carboxylase beta subunit
MSALRLGVDVGGTNTDAVLVRNRSLVASFKTPTTEDVETGVFHAIQSLLESAGVGAHAIATVMIGTTQFTNAFIERRRLVPIGVIRLAAPATTSVPPLYDWPDELLKILGREVVIVGGGYEFDGREIAPLDEAAVRDAARKFQISGVRSFAISCAFAPINPSMEFRAAEIVRAQVPGALVSLSSEFGRIGLLERENATAMNASLLPLAETVVGSFRRALKNLGIQAPFFISQNDGTLMHAGEVERRPVMTFASGPTNSMRGAALLSGLDDAIVVDIGGTTTDVGCLVRSFPRESALTVDIGGVRTNFRMPDLISIGLGGGSLVTFGQKAAVGPRSVGYELVHQARVFGGAILTATDIAVASGAADIGNRSLVNNLAPFQVNAALDEIHRLVEDAIDRMKTNKADVPVVLVGGGSILITRALKGVGRVLVPENSSVANAVGAAIAQVGGEVDSYFDYELQGREAVLDAAKSNAFSRAIAAGAESSSLRIVEVDEVPLGYLPGKKVRVRVKAIGDLNLGLVANVQ